MRPPIHYLTHNGERMNITNWAKRIGISCITLRQRLRAGWSIERALTTKLYANRGPKRKPKPIAPLPRSSFAPSIAADLPALLDYQRDMHAAHRQMTQSVRMFVRSIEAQFAGLRQHLDQAVADHHKQTYRGVVENIKQRPSDRINSSAQDIS
jgi:hypothetical protein